jgi:ectoine hydroxylase-related dioxygenase (phytanoyl-CoA dioxygenase family)
MQIDDAARRSYDEDGVACLRGVFEPHWIERLRVATEDAMRAPGPHAEDYVKPGGTGRFFGDLDLWQRHAAFRDFVFHSPAAEIAGRLMGASSVNFFYDQLLVKEPGTAERTPWHQDQPYWAVSGWQVCSIWLPLDRVSKTTSVAYVAGSHRWGRAFNPYHFADGTPYHGTGLQQLPDIDAERDQYDVRSFDVEPGDCLVFQAMIVHGAPGNASSNTRRRALATRWTGDDARYAPRDGEIAIPTSDPGLTAGDSMTCAAFPRVWSALAR